MERPDWFDHAACSGVTRDLWFTDDPVLRDEGIAICSACPVQFDCLTDAMQRRETEGTWGGIRFNGQGSGLYGTKARQAWRQGDAAWRLFCEWAFRRIRGDVGVAA